MKNADEYFFEHMQSDLKLLQHFRENYKEDILQGRFNRKINQLSIILLMLSAMDEESYIDYEQ